MKISSLTRTILLVTVVSGILFSCVPAKQFEDVKAEKENCEKERTELKKQNEDLVTENNELKATIKKNEREISTLVADTAIKSNSYRILTQQYDKISLLYNQLLENQEKLRASADSEQQKAMAALQKSRDELQAKEDELRNLESSLMQERAKLEAMKLITEQKERELNEKNSLLESQRNELSSKNSELDSKTAKVAELQAILNAKDSAMNALKSKVSEALSGFEGKGLSVTQKEGKVYVSLDEKLLFKSGKWDVDPKGQDALKKLATVLETNQDVNITIEGHTDDLAYSGNGNIQDNWDLSTKRATSIVKIILANSKIDPVRLIASGRSCYLPIDDSKTAEARAKNRRTEIILTPKLDILYELTK
ncbi:MAG: OmpA family protein [Bacteroidales bacterium]|nr:OmpA family protein [Bacteroidales bacterium]